MAINPETNRIEPLVRDELAAKLDQIQGRLLRLDGTPVPKTWSTFQLGELIVIKDYTFRVAYIGETAILFEPVGVVDVKP